MLKAVILKLKKQMKKGINNSIVLDLIHSKSKCILDTNVKKITSSNTHVKKLTARRMISGQTQEEQGPSHTQSPCIVLQLMDFPMDQGNG